VTSTGPGGHLSTDRNDGAGFAAGDFDFLFFDFFPMPPVCPLELSVTRASTDLPAVGKLGLFDVTRDDFDAITTSVRGFRWRQEVEVVEIGSPQRLAPHALALEAEVKTAGDEAMASGRLVILHNPAGDETWDGCTRLVSFTQAQVEFEMATDPLLADVAWSWLTDALRHADADHTAASGTVTAMTSRSFGELDTKPDCAEVEVRCSWTALDDGKIARHVAAWQEMLCQLAGLEPLADGVITLGRRAVGTR